MGWTFTFDEVIKEMKKREKDELTASPVGRGVMPLAEWIENTCPKLGGEIETHAWECLRFSATQHEMDIFIRCCMASIRQEFEAGA